MIDEQDGIRFIECKVTVENREGIGGDFERNFGGTQKERRVTFDGYATPELYAAITKAIEEVSK